jgi:hypothetical protein
VLTTADLLDISETATRNTNAVERLQTQIDSCVTNDALREALEALNGTIKRAVEAAAPAAIDEGVPTTVCPDGSFTVALPTDTVALECKPFSGCGTVPVIVAGTPGDSQTLGSDDRCANAKSCRELYEAMTSAAAGSAPPSGWYSLTGSTGETAEYFCDMGDSNGGLNANRLAVGKGWTLVGRYQQTDSQASQNYAFNLCDCGNGNTATCMRSCNGYHLPGANAVRKVIEGDEVRRLVMSMDADRLVFSPRRTFLMFSSTVTGTHHQHAVLQDGQQPDGTLQQVAVSPQYNNCVREFDGTAAEALFVHTGHDGTLNRCTDCSTYSMCDFDHTCHSCNGWNLWIDPGQRYGESDRTENDEICATTCWNGDDGTLTPAAAYSNEFQWWTY